MRMASAFSSPAETWLAYRTPFAPCCRRTSTLPSSSSLRLWTNVVRSAHSSVIDSPVMCSIRFSAWVPMSPMQELMPACAGSVRHAACFMPVASSSLASHPCGYSTTTLRIRPMEPSRTRRRASLTIG